MQAFCNTCSDFHIEKTALAPVLAIFMGFYKSKWLNEYNLNKTIFFKIC